MSKVKRPRRLRRRRNITLGTISVLLALALIASLVLGPKDSHSRSAPGSIQVTNDDLVLVPTPIRPIARGERIADVSFAYVKWPKSQLTGDYVRELQAHRDKLAAVPLPERLPVPLSALSDALGESNAVVEGIPEGMRAITVKVDAESAVEGWARSGNHVDVILIRAASDSDVGLEAKIIAENVKILSAGRSAAPVTGGTTAPRAPNTVTLLTTQEQALKIKTAAMFSKLAFSLRGRGDDSPTTALSSDQRSILGKARTLPLKETYFEGFAQGPNGERYVLDGGSGWVRSKAKIDPLTRKSME